jgi:hypothetical protein
MSHRQSARHAIQYFDGWDFDDPEFADRPTGRWPSELDRCVLPTETAPDWASGLAAGERAWQRPIMLAGTILSSAFAVALLILATFTLDNVNEPTPPAVVSHYVETLTERMLLPQTQSRPTTVVPQTAPPTVTVTTTHHGTPAPTRPVSPPATMTNPLEPPPATMTNPLEPPPATMTNPLEPPVSDSATE